MPCEPGRRSPITIHLGRVQYRAGETVAALIDGVARPVRVALVRVERRPCGEAVVPVDAQELREGYGVLELSLPPGALPTAEGSACALSYAVQVRADGILHRAGLEVSAEGCAHIAEGSSGGGPLIAGWDARHFHLELAEALLGGGGRIAGRIHRHGSWRSTALAVRVRCDECWRPSAAATRAMPSWHDQTLWAAEEMIQLDPEQAWAPFSFDLPLGLPPGVEGRSIAWRYELWARRRRRHGPDETAALTPLLFDERAGYRAEDP